MQQSFYSNFLPITCGSGTFKKWLGLLGFTACFTLLGSAAMAQVDVTNALVGNGSRDSSPAVQNDRRTPHFSSPIIGILTPCARAKVIASG